MKRNDMLRSNRSFHFSFCLKHQSIFICRKETKMKHTDERPVASSWWEFIRNFLNCVGHSILYQSWNGLGWNHLSRECKQSQPHMRWQRDYFNFSAPVHNWICGYLGTRPECQSVHTSNYTQGQKIISIWWCKHNRFVSCWYTRHEIN